MPVGIRPSDYNLVYSEILFRKLFIEFHRAYLYRDTDTMNQVLQDVVLELPNKIKPAAQRRLIMMATLIKRIDEDVDSNRNFTSTQKVKAKNDRRIALLMETKDDIVRLMDKVGLLVIQFRQGGVASL